MSAVLNNHTRVASGRVLGIDAGERRVGLALSDATRLLATPFGVLHRTAGLAPVLDAIADLVQREDVTELVVGLPLNADGSAGRQAKRSQDFARVARRVVGVPVTLWDERLSTRAAEAIIRAQGQSVRQRKDMDAVAAAVILQDYLDHLRRSAAP
jgi:putative Holliday junction resolvase